MENVCILGLAAIKSKFILPCALLLALVMTGCAYSFTGAALPADVKTVNVTRFDNIASNVIPAAAQELTELLRDKFLTQTNLKLVKTGADLEFSGSIVDYSIEPITVQANDQAAQNRIRVKIMVTYVNNRYPDQNWEQPFERYLDVPRTASLGAQEKAIIQQLHEQLVQDVFNKSLGNW